MKIFGWWKKRTAAALREEITRLKQENLDLNLKLELERERGDHAYALLESQIAHTKKVKQELEAKYADELQKRLELAKLVREMEQRRGEGTPPYGEANVEYGMVWDAVLRGVEDASPYGGADTEADGKSWCGNRGCPFTDCERHLANCVGEIDAGTQLAHYDIGCKRYISRLVDEMLEEQFRDTEAEGEI